MRWFFSLAIVLVVAAVALADGPFKQRVQFFPGSTPVTDRHTWPAAFVVDGVPSGDKVCWVRGTQPTVRLKIRYTGPAASYEVSSWGSYQPQTGPSVPITTTTTTISCPEGPVDVIFETQLVGLPNFVTKGHLYIYFTFDNEPLNIVGNSDLDCRVYLVQSQPTDLMASPNWVDALEEVCLWANGLQDKDECRVALTNGVFSLNASYHPDSPQFAVIPGKRYRLKSFFDARASGTVMMDCQDVSGYLAIASQSLGSQLGLIRLYAQKDYVNWPFRTQPIAGIGRNPSINDNYIPYNFNFHSINRSGFVTYDACAAQKKWPGLAPLMGPPYGLTEQNYWQWNFLLDWTGLAANYVAWIGTNSIPFKSESWYIEELE